MPFGRRSTPIVLFAIVPLLGGYMARVFTYDAKRPQTWKAYAGSVIAFSVMSWLVLYAILRKPDREIHVSVPTPLDRVGLAIFDGYRVQHNTGMGPYFGPLRLDNISSFTVQKFQAKCRADGRTSRHRESAVLRGRAHPRGRSARLEARPPNVTVTEVVRGTSSVTNPTSCPIMIGLSNPSSRMMSRSRASTWAIVPPRAIRMRNRTVLGPHTASPGSTG